MADIENPINIEKGSDVQGTSPAEDGAIPAAVLEKASEYGVQPGQWQQYGQHIQDEYNRIMGNIMAEYRLLDQVEQDRIVRALESGDEHALDEVLLMVDAHLKGQDRELPHVLSNLKKVAAQKVLELAATGKLAPIEKESKTSSGSGDALSAVVEVVMTLFQTMNRPDQEVVRAGIQAGDFSVLQVLFAKLTTFGYDLSTLDIKELQQRVSARLLSTEV